MGGFQSAPLPREVHVSLACRELQTISASFFTQQVPSLKLNDERAIWKGITKWQHLCLMQARKMHIRTLNLSHNNLCAIPSELSCLCSLTQLGTPPWPFLRLTQTSPSLPPVATDSEITLTDVSHNNLAHMGDDVFALKLLATLELAFNQLLRLSDAVGGIQSLRRLTLQVLPQPSELSSITCTFSTPLRLFW